MLLPVLALTLVDRLNVAATDMIVSASVMAGLPSDVPVITSPKDGDVLLSKEIAVSGTCPVYEPAVIVAIYNNGGLAGSARCTSSGTFSVPIRLSYGTNTLVPRAVSITNEIGPPGAAVTVTLPLPLTGGQTGVGEFTGIGMPLRIVPTDIFALISTDGNTSWRASFEGGKPPYQVRIDWGDGTIDRVKVGDDTEQAFHHDYGTIRYYDITVTATDSANSMVVMHIAGVTRFVQVGAAGLDANLDQVPPFIAYIQKYVVQIYIVTLFALLFLWYLEHGRHIAIAPTKARKRRVRH